MQQRRLAQSKINKLRKINRHRQLKKTHTKTHLTETTSAQRTESNLNESDFSPVLLHLIKYTSRLLWHVIALTYKITSIKDA